METQIKSLKKEQEKLHNQLTSTFTKKEQFVLLGKLIDTEIELESYCEQ